jgi:hypothetical protein
MSKAGKIVTAEWQRSWDEGHQEKEGRQALRVGE